MSAPRLYLSVFVLMLAVITLSEGLRGTGPKKCCFSYHEKPVAKSRVVSYFKTSQRCPKPAVLLRTGAGRQLCGDPATPWVKDIISYLNTNSIPGKMSKE